MLDSSFDAETVEKWQHLVETSPQATLFHTPEWIQMLANTEPHPCAIHPLFYENDGAIQGALILRSRNSHARTTADLPACGYTGPLFSPELHYQANSHTYASFNALSGLLHEAGNKFDDIIIENPPEIWNVSSYNFNSWMLEPTYNHIWEKQSETEAWLAITPQLQNSIRSADKKYRFSIDQDNQAYDGLFQRLSLRNALTGGKYEGDKSIVRNRINWMREHDLCKLFSLMDNSGNVLRSIVVVTSSQNKTAYLLYDFAAGNRDEPDVDACLYWNTYLQLGDDLQQFDLGKSSGHESAQLRNNLGCRMVSRFTARFTAKK
jgi:hypothetical protein